MLAIQIIRARGLPTKDDYFTTVNFCGEEIFRTEGCHKESNGDPIWQDADEFQLDQFNKKEEENKRPLFLEKISILVFAERGEKKSELVGEARVPLANIGPPRWYRLVPPKTGGPSWEAQILTTLSFPQHRLMEISNTKFLPLTSVLDTSSLRNGPLFLNFSDSPLSILGAKPLPGPICGELLLDYHGAVEVEMTTGVNLFKDKCSVKCEGSLYLTDIRLIFIPNSLTPSPPGFLSTPLVVDGEWCSSEEALLAVRRMTLQIPISSIQDIKCQNARDLKTSSLRILCRNSMSVEFCIKKQDDSTSIEETLLEKKLGDQYYNGGLLSRNMPPFLWCTRISEELKWLIREDLCWIRWAEYLGHSIELLFLSSNNSTASTEKEDGFAFRDFAGGSDAGAGDRSLKRAYMKVVASNSKAEFLDRFGPTVGKFIDVPNTLKDYRRMGLHADTKWKISDLNDEHELCSTYPSVLVFPASLSDEEIKNASFARSKQRLPSLVWVHPKSRTPLCRCAQPLAGISGVNVSEADVKMCLAIRGASSNDTKQLRILDCRPKINAQANAIQGKGFENIGSLGGAEGATLVFADIHNIHVMREALQRLREINTYGDSDDGNGSVAVSKWLHHVATVLRGAAAAAESLLLEHPVLVHCSDGWDRTAQISALTQLLLDPHYRTVDGFLMLMEKEWIGFGFQFAERHGRLTDKGTSPIFAQYLDCVWQLLNQYPTEFEFSSGLLEVILESAYSGLFSSFRTNCELQRINELIQHAESALNTSNSAVHYSSVFTYIHILLSTSMSSLLINPSYRGLPDNDSSVKYLHPRCGVEDLTLWTQGLLPRGFNSFTQGGGRTELSSLECSALASEAHSGVLRQWRGLERHAHLGRAATLRVMSGQLHGPLLSLLAPHENAFTTKLKHLRRAETDFCRGLSSDHKHLSAVLKVQLWYRGEVLLRRARVGNKSLTSSEVVTRLSRSLMTLYIRSQYKESLARCALKHRLAYCLVVGMVDFVMDSYDEMSRTCHDFMSSDEDTSRSTMLAGTTGNDSDSDFDASEEVSAESPGGSRMSTKMRVASMKTNFFSKISKGFIKNK